MFISVTIEIMTIADVVGVTGRVQDRTIYTEQTVQ